MGPFNDFSDKAVTGGRGGNRRWQGVGGEGRGEGQEVGQRGTMWEEAMGGQEEKVAVAGGTRERRQEVICGDKGFG